MSVGDLLRTLGALSPTHDGLRLPPSSRLSQPCTGVTHDSRAVRAGMVFVACRGLRADGTAFAPMAIAAGAAAVVAERPPDAAVPVPWAVVTDARLALALLAAEYYGHPSREMPVVGITGTNGKTTTSFIVRSIFETAGTSCGLLGTVGYNLGGRTLDAPRTTPEASDLQRLLREMRDEGAGACVMEVSSHALALRRVAGVRFAAGVFTNLTRDHLDFHADMEDYFSAKRRLFEQLPPDAPAIINIDDPKGTVLADTVLADTALGGTVLANTSRLVTYGITKPADVSPGPLSISLDGLRFDIRLPQGVVHVRSALVGKPNVYNILAAAGVTAALGVPLDAIEQGLARLSGVPGRFEMVSRTGDDITVVVDYAHTDDALRNLLETARSMAPRRLVTVFGAGGDRDRPKRPLMGMVAARLSDVVVITSDNPRSEDPVRIIEEVKRGADSETRQSGAEVVTIVDRAAAIEHAVSQARGGDVILIAGKGHETYQVIGDRATPFSDVAVAREALDARRLKSGVG
jgi:UDP-N-acetylmuramoyl-L-alanyl-D-glutamate--2,6-diaminopimelate ligase